MGEKNGRVAAVNNWLAMIFFLQTFHIFSVMRMRRNFGPAYIFSTYVLKFRTANSLATFDAARFDLSNFGDHSLVNNALTKLWEYQRGLDP